MRDIPTSPRVIEIRHKNRVRKWRRFILFLILFICIIVALSYFSKDKNVTLDKFVITGVHIINQKDVEDEINKYISGNYMRLFSKANSFIYPHDKIYNNLLLNFPRIEKLSVDRDDLKTLHIDITERIGSHLYCGEVVPEDKNEIGENCYFINNDGFIFDKAPYFSGNVYFKYYMTLRDEVANPLGKYMTDVDQFHKLARFIDGVTSIGLKPIYLFTDKDNTNYLYLYHKENSSSPKIIFNNDNLEEIQENLSVAIRNKEFADEVNSKYNTLLYIDLRFDNKVLYKFE